MVVRDSYTADQWFLADGGTGNRHVVARVSSEWFGMENIRPRELHAELRQALLRGATQWREFLIEVEEA